MKRFFVPLMFLVLLFMGALPAAAAPAAIPVATTASIVPENVVFWISSSENNTVKEAADAFCGKLSELTGGSLTANLRESPDIGYGFINTGGQFALFDKSAGAALNPKLSDSPAPFGYGGYEAFSMSANSRKAMVRLSEEFKANGNPAVPLGVYYNGSTQLLSYFPLYDITYYIAEEKENGDVTYGVFSGESQAARGFSEIGISVRTMSDPDLRKNAVISREAVFAEFTTAELYNMAWTETGIMVNFSYHDIDARLLIADEAFYSGLSPFHKAAIKEAAAHLFPLIDGRALANERLTAEKLAASNIPAIYDLTDMRQAINRALLIADSVQQPVPAANSNRPA